ncbi:hypothetical protein [Yinghuangia sp. YIM S09857]|uniref:hypothetical protein n=1 Tax=Yinghuangia sp. YIM S09857 TaxID=3436929 RepID=UPI003F53C21D
MSGRPSAVNMARVAVVLRCFADFVAARPGLPVLVGLHVDWSHVTERWSIKGQLPGADTGELERWALALDDPSVTSYESEGYYVGPHKHREVHGTVHGHRVSVWAHLPPGGPR